MQLNNSTWKSLTSSKTECVVGNGLPSVSSTPTSQPSDLAEKPSLDSTSKKTYDLISVVLDTDIFWYDDDIIEKKVCKDPTTIRVDVPDIVFKELNDLKNNQELRKKLKQEDEEIRCIWRESLELISTYRNQTVFVNEIVSLQGANKNEMFVNEVKSLAGRCFKTIIITRNEDLSTLLKSNNLESCVVLSSFKEFDVEFPKIKEELDAKLKKFPTKIYSLATAAKMTDSTMRFV